MKDNKLCAAIAQNPVMVLFLGTCPALGATSAVLPALTLGAAALAVMVLASLAASLLRNAVSTRVKPLTNFILVAGFAAIVQLLMHAWFPAQFNALGVYTTLLAVDLLVYAETERASDRPVGAALADSLLTGLGFALALVVTALIRELFGTCRLPADLCRRRLLRVRHCYGARSGYLQKPHRGSLRRCC